MILNILLLIVGFVILIKGSDLFVDGSSSIARNFKVSTIVIGLTIVAFGTSSPELAVSIKSLLSGSGDMTVGNVIGSNIINVLLILGICAIINPLKIRKNTINKEIPMSLLITCLLVILLSDIMFDSTASSVFSRSDAAVTILFFMIFIYYLINVIKNRDLTSEEEIVEVAPKYGIIKSIIFTLIGLAGLVVGSDLIVDNASIIATSLGVSERIVGLTIIAIGTSLPELVTSITAVLKGEEDIMIGNIVGSNIFNICIVLGLPTLIFGDIATTSFTGIDLIFFAIASVFLYLFASTNKRITRKEGIIMLLCFIAYYTILFII